VSRACRWVPWDVEGVDSGMGEGETFDSGGVMMRLTVIY